LAGAGLVLLIRLPFLNQAIQGDDHIYLTEASHALIDPLHPDNTNTCFRVRKWTCAASRIRLWMDGCWPVSSPCAAA